jgi:hypothetical protein
MRRHRRRHESGSAPSANRSGRTAFPALLERIQSQPRRRRAPTPDGARRVRLRVAARSAVAAGRLHGRGRARVARPAERRPGRDRSSSARHRRRRTAARRQAPAGRAEWERRQQRQDAAVERFHAGPQPGSRFPETSQPLDRERLFRCAPIFHLTGRGECINSCGTGLAKAACLTPRRHFRPIDKNRFPARGMSQVLLMAIFSCEPCRFGTSMPATVFRKALP